MYRSDVVRYTFLKDHPNHDIKHWLIVMLESEVPKNTATRKTDTWDENSGGNTEKDRDAKCF